MLHLVRRVEVTSCVEDREVYGTIIEPYICDHHCGEPFPNCLLAPTAGHLGAT